MKRTYLLSLLVVLSATSSAQDAAKCGQLNAENQNWQKNLSWCIGNTDAGGAVNCSADYATTYPECIASGGRSCIMGKAINSAKAGDKANAYRLSLMCQCHNTGAKDGIMYCAGQDAVANYLKAK